MSKWHWLLMMQPYDLPEKLLSSVPAEYYIKKKLSKRGASLDFCNETFDEYVELRLVAFVLWVNTKGVVFDPIMKFLRELGVDVFELHHNMVKNRKNTNINLYI